MIRITVALALSFMALGQSGPKSPDIGTNVEQPAVDFYDSISDYFGYSRRAVDLIVKKGVAAEEIPAVLYIAKHSHATARQVIDARNAGRDFGQIARQYNVKLPGEDVVVEANVAFLSGYHGQPAEQIRAMHAKGASFVDINQQFRRVGFKPRTEPGTRSRNQ